MSVGDVRVLWRLRQQRCISSAVCSFVLSCIPVRCTASSSTVSAMSSNLAFLFHREGVDSDFRAKLEEHGVASVAKFGALVDTQSELRELLSTEFGMTSTGGLAVKAKIAAMVGWSTFSWFCLVGRQCLSCARLA